MKCKYCNGTGTSNTCVNGTFKPCSFCDGTGEFDPNEVDRFNAVDVIKVMEMVKKPQTNEEWIKQCNTEQLAEWIAHQTMIALLENQNNHSLRMTYPAYWVEWLKQPHTTKE